MIIEKLDESNALLYAAKHYENPNCFDTVEFYEDLNRFKYIKRLLNKYQESGDLKEQLIINHLTIIYNVFGVEAGTRLLFLRLKDHWSYIKPFLVLMGTCPEIVHAVGVDGKNINTDEIIEEPGVVELLRKING
jgi:hypothetical protein